MGHLSSCYFCGVAVITPLERYRLPDSDGKTVTLCSTCRHKLDTVLESSGVAGPEPLPDDAESVSTPDPEPGDVSPVTTGEAGHSLGDDDPGATGTEGDRRGSAAAPSGDGGGSDGDSADGEGDGPDSVDEAELSESSDPEAESSDTSDDHGDDELPDPGTEVPEAEETETTVVETEDTETAETSEGSEPDDAGPGDADSPDGDGPGDADSPDHRESHDPPGVEAEEPSEGIDPSIIQADEIATGKAEIEDVLGEQPSPDAEREGESEEHSGEPGDGVSDPVASDQEDRDPVQSPEEFDTGGQDTEGDPFADLDAGAGDTEDDPLAEDEPLGADDSPATEGAPGDGEPIAEEDTLTDESGPEEEEAGSLETDLAELREDPPGHSPEPSDPPEESTSPEGSADQGSVEDDGGFAFDQGEKDEGIDQDLQEQMEPDVPEAFGNDEPTEDEPADGARADPGRESEETTQASPEPTSAGSGEDGGGSAEPSISALEYNKVMRLLQNREFPVNRIEIETVAANAYDLSEAECAEVIDIAIDRGLLAEENGDLHKPE